MQSIANIISSNLLSSSTDNKMGSSVPNRRRSIDRQSRRIRPSALYQPPAKKELRHGGTASTTAPSSGGSLNDSHRRGSGSYKDDPAFAALQKKICPVTGVLRDITADYDISRTILGKGHYGMVRECTHRKSPNRILAVKSVDKSKIKRLDHLRREVYLLYKMDHDGIMKMIDCYEDPKYVHIITERYTGGELFDKISQATTPKGCFSEDKAAKIIQQLLEAVAYLHANEIVHRDIKPENILLETNSEECDRIKLIDFGLSRRHKANEAPMNNPVGTAYYMSPELLLNNYDKSCDVWSIGTIVYILLCGYPPFNGDTDPDIFEAIKRGKFAFPKQAWGNKSDDVKDFIKCLLKMDPKKRLTAKQALNHPWIRKHCSPAVAVVSDGEEEEESSHEDLLARIQSLRSTIQKFKKSVQKENLR
jgi:serine/threonine protein kinase